MSSTRRVFRIQKILIKWNKQDLTKEPQEYFSDQTIQIDSVCKHPSVSSKTALVTFFGTILDTPSALRDSYRDIELIFYHCLRMTTLYTPLEVESVSAEYLLPHLHFSHTSLMLKVLFLSTVSVVTSSVPGCPPMENAGPATF